MAAEKPLRLVTSDAATCGEHGGRTRDGDPCERPAGWGFAHTTGPCKTHIYTAQTPHGSRPPPAHLSPESAALWVEITSMYVFGPEGFPVLEAALTARDRAAEARQHIEETGLLFVNEDSGTPHSNPMLRVERDALKEFRLAWKQLDLDVSPPEET